MKTIAQSVPQIFQGISYMTAIISSVVSALAGFGAGWYVKGRGMTGVQIDLNNVKSDVENLKAKILPNGTATAVA